jgi:RNA polymerase sigma-70 factor (ECF subfamily)
MQVTDSHHVVPPLSGEEFLGRLEGRLRELGSELRSTELAGILSVLIDRSRAPEAVRDAISTRLMEAFRLGSGRGAFGLLYELNADQLLVQVASRLRRYASKADPRDVLQEVFFNIYRYPHRFNAEREDAFRVWSAMIVRNTVLKHLRAQGHGGRAEVAIDDLSGEPEIATSNPLHSAVERESRKECERVYLTYLHLYLRFYTMLSERERQALQLVEVEERSYREAAEALGIKLENLKMVIFRARRKIHRSMRRVFDGLSPDCRPARGPRGTGAAADPSRMAEEDPGDDRQEVDAHGI